MVDPKGHERGTSERERVVSEFDASRRSVARRLISAPIPALRELGKNALCMVQMLTARDFALSPATAALIVTTLAYFVSPIDLVPDTIAVVGYLDDALLVAEVAILLSADMARFRARTETPTPEPRAAEPRAPIEQEAA